MCQPNEVLAIVDENENAFEGVIDETENNSFYGIMKKIIINLTYIDTPLMEKFFQKRLD